MARTHILDFPVELIGAIIDQTSSASDTLNLGRVCKRAYSLAVASPVWRRHCLSTWEEWDPSHDLDDKITKKPLETDWHALYLERRQTERRASRLFESLLAKQQARESRMHELASLGPDIKDQVKGWSVNTPDDADDVLARRWHADAILAMQGRRQAVDIWCRLQRGEHVDLEDALGAYDMFVLPCISQESYRSRLDALTTAVRDSIQGFVDMTIREKAVSVARYLRSKGIIGLRNMEEYHALRNNFISLTLALADDEENDHKGCLPLQSVAIFCSVARRLGVPAQPCDFPGTVLAVVTAPSNMTLDGEPRDAEDDPRREPERMFMDPFHHDREVGSAELLAQLAQTHLSPDVYAETLGPADELDMVLRAGRNILVSVDNQQYTEGEWIPDPMCSKYAALWPLFIIGDKDPVMSSLRRRQACRHLALRLESEFAQDRDMYAEAVAQISGDVLEFRIIAQGLRDSTQAAIARVPRPTEAADPVQHRIGTHFVHKRYRYDGFIIGWNPICAADPQWISQMRVDELPRGRSQPFYKIIAADGTSRYVAEDNITRLLHRPLPPLMRLAGKYFKRWDEAESHFVSNMREEYPDD